MSRINIIMAISMLVTLVWSPPSSASRFVREGSFEVGLQMGGYFFVEDEALRKDTFGYHIHGAYNVNELLGVDLSFGFAPSEVNSDALYNIHLDLLVHPMQHAWFVPFVGVGPSFTVIAPAVGGDDNDPGISVLAGMKLYPWDQVGFRIDARYLLRIGTSAGEPMSHDMMANFGLFATFGGDEETGTVLLDTDGDGFLDDVDACPRVPGVASGKGCPDADEDTIVDADDRCPNEPGTPKHAGCPDGDGDGLVDIDDRCPKVAGSSANKGCPDTDKDGLVDVDDRCPKIPGDVAHQGCPPPPPPEVDEEISGRMEGIRFEKDSAEVKIGSRGTNKVLERAVEILAKYEHVIIRIDGHTSSEGSDEHNDALSQRRAEAVKSYLTGRGVAADRIETKGFGKRQPECTPADTNKCMKLNRRIEFTILRK